jgi:EpsD family peptidyl-prolyl cis-trans isomerase
MARPVSPRLPGVPSRRWLSIALVGASVLTACGGRGGAADSQVAAKVNKGEISIHQIQTIVQRQPPQVADDRTEQAAARVLEVLIDQELAAQAARDQGLDREPRVVQSIEAARRELLAHAYQDRVAADTLVPSSDEIDRYYEAHPALFAQRRLYLLQETAVEATPEQLGKLQEIVGRIRSTDELLQILRDAKLRHQVRLFAQAAEDLPLTLLEPLSKLEVGQSWLYAQAGGGRIFTVVHAHPAPIDRRMASNAIGAYLVTERKRQRVAQAMKNLRDSAKIEYVGSFAQTRPPAAAASK